MKAIRTSFAVAALLVGAASAAAAQQAAPPRTPPRMLHPLAGKAACLTCHGPAANEHIKSTPASHHYVNAACPMCHRPTDKTPPNAPHTFSEAMSNCRTCHAANSTSGAKVPPEWHATFNVSICATCHQPGQGS